MPRLPQRFKDFALCFSVANLCYFRSWTALEEIHRSVSDYFAQQRSSVELELLTVVNALLLTGILWLLLLIVGDSRSRLIRYTAGAFLTLAFGTAGIQFGYCVLQQSPRLARTILSPACAPWLISLALAALPVIVVGWFQTAARVASAIAMFMFPKTVMNVLLVAWWAIITPPPQAYASRPAPGTALGTQAGGSPRLVWIIFDELDQRLAFVERPEGVDLGEFDRLRSQSLFATAARSPAMHTLLSLPSLVTGRTVVKADPGGISELMLWYQGAPSAVPWSSQPNLFREARGAGLRVGLLGWYHPYCRVLGADLDSCAWFPVTDIAPAFRWKAWTERFGILGALGRQFSREFALGEVLSGPEAGYGTSLPERLSSLEDKTEELAEIRRRALELVGDFRFQLVFLHLPIPHPPALYDPRTKRFTGKPGHGYSDNLQGADQILGDLRRAMEHAGLWDRSAVLISSDHPLRGPEYGAGLTEDDKRLIRGKLSPFVPFLLKLPDQQRTVTFSPGFNTVVSRGLLESILRGAIAGPEQAVEWLSAHTGS
jgi:hypothetical protein